jgi:hypothetical protein
MSNRLAYFNIGRWWLEIVRDRPFIRVGKY